MNRINVEVVYALRARQESVHLQLPKGATVGDAVKASGLLERHKQLRIGNGFLGIFGETCDPGVTLRDGDRVEFYRPLPLDPKQARRRRAAAAARAVRKA